MHACSLFRNASTARSIASCGKSSRIASSTVLNSASLVGFGVNTLYRSSIAPQTWLRSCEFGGYSSFLSNSGLCCPDPFLSEARRMDQCAILMEYEVVWQQAFTVLDELRKQIIQVEICIHLHFHWHQVKPSLSPKHTPADTMTCGENLARWIKGRRGSTSRFLPLDEEMAVTLNTYSNRIGHINKLPLSGPKINSK